MITSDKSGNEREVLIQTRANAIKACSQASIASIGDFLKVAETFGDRIGFSEVKTIITNVAKKLNLKDEYPVRLGTYEKIRANIAPEVFKHFVDQANSDKATQVHKACSQFMYALQNPM